MAEDTITTLRLSANASGIAARIAEDSQRFSDSISVAKFAMAYAIKNFYDDINIEEIDKTYDSEGSTYNVGSVDADKFIYHLIKSLYPDAKDPYKVTRTLMIYGLEKLGELLDNGQLYPLSNLM